MAAPTSVLSLFAGCGGLDLSVRIVFPQARTVCYVEGEAAAVEILASRIQEGTLDDAPIWSDARTFRGKPWRGRVDTVIAGFPCPPVSVAGKQLGTADPRWLWPEVERIVGEVRPRLLFLENVRGLLSADDGAPAREVVGGLARLRMSAEWLCLSARSVGAGHRRERWFCLGHAESSGRQRDRNVAGGNGEGLHDDCRAGPDVANTARRRRGALRQPSGGDGQPDGSDGVVADAARLQRGPQPEDGRRAERRIDAAGASGTVADSARHGGHGPERQAGSGRGVCEAGDGVGAAGTVGDAECDGRQAGELRLHGQATESAARVSEDSEQRCGGVGATGTVDNAGEHGRRSCEPGREEDRREIAGWGSGGSDLPIFAPGPNSPAWPAILRDAPWLAPAISEEEAQSLLRLMVDGDAASLLVRSRVDQLRAAGNAVVALQGAVAVAELFRRF